MSAPDPKVVALLESRPTCEHEEEAWREHDASIHCHVCDAQVLADAGIGDVDAAEAEAHNLEADYDRRGERLWRLYLPATSTPSPWPVAEAGGQ